MTKPMKLKPLLALTLCTASLLAPRLVGAQSIDYLDNTSQTVSGNFGLFNGQGDIFAQFQTGNNADGYMLNSISILFSNATGNPGQSGGFSSVSLCPDFGNTPGAPIVYDFLGNDAPTNAQLYTYTPPSSLTLNANTDYWIGAGAFSSSGAYELSETASTTTGIDGWTITGNVSNQGTPVANNIPQFAINATPINAAPEPTTLALAGLGAVGWLLFRRLHEMDLQGNLPPCLTFLK